MPNKKTLSWRPRAKGEVFCSPACGHGCKRAAYVKAHARARAIARSLGKGWKPQVWENLGWHWGATRGSARVNPRSGGFWSTIDGSFVGEGRLPATALASSIQQVIQEIGRLRALLDEHRA
jgi:hypothetical protein